MEGVEEVVIGQESLVIRVLILEEVLEFMEVVMVIIQMEVIFPVQMVLQIQEVGGVVVMMVTAKAVPAS